jgi:hypothetical protein
VKAEDLMTVRDGDLAALLFRSRDTISSKTAFLKGRALQEGESVTITLESRVERTPSGGLIFGPLTGEVVHGV